MRGVPSESHPKSIVPPDRAPGGGALTIGHLAHELNSLLDGSMRCLRLAQGALNSAGSSSDHSDDALVKLQTASESMAQMARLLERAMSNRFPAMSLFAEKQNLDTQVRQILKSVEPLAIENRVAISVELTPKARSIPTATLGPVILNGLRNAIQACAASDHSNRYIELSVAISPRNELLILILDNGIGLSGDPATDRLAIHNGHGYGLDLCRQILRELNGRLRLCSVPDGGGTILQVTVPLRSLMNHG